ncbi:MAG: riboflavin synthase [Gemmatimonadales bacterium]|nr:MAG: riboflavin synthase [Gemmatimonadales bacterium]
MFTGIIEAVGVVTRVRERDRIRAFTIETPEGFLDGVTPGDSISVDGACLTPVRVEDSAFEVEAIGTTLGRTRAGRYTEGSRVNLEKAMVLGGRLDGHLVQGHVDGVGELMSIRDDGEFWILEFRIPTEVHELTLLHGSITLNGVSLTVNGLDEPDRISVGIIPHTWNHTTMSTLEPGDPVNVEGDLIGKYVGTVLRRVGFERPSSS